LQYNETINDLLGNAEFDKKKHEIKHDAKGTRVTDATVLPLGSALQVRTLLSLAQSRRTVAATLMNERSSRSHSVFTLRVTGVNELTGETCEGSLNLVDLAGSERLNASGAGSDKDRLRETQNINKSLSALGDVIAALGEKGEKADKHIPYRNSKVRHYVERPTREANYRIAHLPSAKLFERQLEDTCKYLPSSPKLRMFIPHADDPQRFTAGLVSWRVIVLPPVRDKGMLLYLDKNMSDLAPIGQQHDYWNRKATDQERISLSLAARVLLCTTMTIATSSTTCIHNIAFPAAILVPTYYYLSTSCLSRRNHPPCTIAWDKCALPSIRATQCIPGSTDMRKERLYAS
jgi:hypothetical protein